MRSRAFGLVILLILTALLAACGQLPGLPAPTSAPATAAPAVEVPTAAPAVSPILTPEMPVTDTVPVSPTVSVPVTPTLAMTDTVATPAEVSVTPVVTTSAPVTPTVSAATPAEAGPVSTYRDDFAGFELDYPVSWSVVDVTPEVKQESTAYSITFMSWKPQEPGTEGIPEGGSKVDVSVAKGTAASPEAAVDSRRQEWTQGDPSSQVAFEEPWDLAGGLSGTHWTVQTSRGETVHELVTAINGHRIVLSGLGDVAQFEQIAMTLRPPAATIAGMGEAAGTEQAAGTPAAQAKEQVAIPLVTGAAGTPESAAAASAVQPLAATVYTVRQGDTLAKIAARFGVTVSAILRANPRITNADLIYIGQRITIPTSGGTQPPPTPVGTTRVNIYMIGMGTGNVGCGDEVVPVRRDIPRTAAPLTAALNLLLAQKSQYYGESGLYNALYQSNLRIASITRSGNAWTINLAGTLRLGGVCDNPRVKAQLEQTARQFSTVQSVRYFINGQPLDTLLSGK